MTEDMAKGETFGTLWATKWGHLGDFEVKDTSGKVVIRAKYDREDEKRIFTRGTQLTLEDGSGTLLCTINKEWLAVKVLDVGGGRVAEIVGDTYWNNGALDFKTFSSAEAKESEAKLLATMLRHVWCMCTVID